MKVADLEARINKLKNAILIECAAFTKDTGFEVAQLSSHCFVQKMGTKHSIATDIEVEVVNGPIRLTL